MKHYAILAIVVLLGLNAALWVSLYAAAMWRERKLRKRIIGGDLQALRNIHLWDGVDRYPTHRNYIPTPRKPITGESMRSTKEG